MVCWASPLWPPSLRSTATTITIRRQARANQARRHVWNGRRRRPFSFTQERSGSRLRSCRVIARPLTLALLVGACTPATPPPRIARVPSTFNGIPREMLAAHNKERASVGVPPMTWSPTLVASASLYANELAATGQFRHSSRQVRPGQGENLWMGTGGAYSPAQMVASWASERGSFRPGIFPAVSRTGNWADIGHYSQMIWPTTTQVGCAIASSRSYNYLVCRYAPAGNIDGHRVP